MNPAPGGASSSAPDAATESRATVSAATALRARTMPQHHATEAAFARYDLTERRSYTLFLQAHAQAVTGAERALAASAGLPPWQPRAPLLRDDLDALNAPIPAPLSFPAVLETGGAWGVLYVLEGSRIGSELLNRQVPQHQPRSYLAASHGPGEWQSFRARLEVGLATGGQPMLERAVAGAKACFNLFATAAGSPDLAPTREEGRAARLQGRSL